MRYLTAAIIFAAAVPAFGQGFKCEQIKEKKVRESCIADRTKAATPPPVAVPTAEEIEQREMRSFVMLAKKEITQSMLDPDSAKFEQLTIQRSEDKKTKTLCGKVNAKNAYGGYVGAKQFFVIVPDEAGAEWKSGVLVPKSNETYEEHKDRVTMTRTWLQYCMDPKAKFTAITE